MTVAPHKQKRIDKLNARIAWIDTMLVKENVPDLDKHILDREKQAWVRLIPVIIEQVDY